MKKYLIFAFMAMSLIWISCKSTEQEETPTEQNTPVVQEEKKDDTPAQTFEETNANLLKAADESRENAIKAGAQNYYGSQLKVTDEMLLALKEKAKDSKEDLSKEINDVNYRYLALQKASQTKVLKEKIEANGFVEDNKVAYDAAEVLLSELEKVINENADGKTMYKSAEATYAAYHTIFYSSFKKLADKERNAALEQKKNADSVKAGVARKNEYKLIVEIFNNGDSCYVTKNPEGAFEKYKESKEKFAALYSDVSEKRAAAQKRIDEAKEKVLSVQNFATDADTQAPLGSEKIDGIEEKDTKLLEEDKFENPEDSVIQVNETVTSTDSTVEVLKDALNIDSAKPADGSNVEAE